MSANTPPGTRVCPQCGTRNSGISLFCAECGSTLSEGNTSYADGSAQTTSTFTTGNSGVGQQTSTWERASDPQATQEFTPHLATHVPTDEGPAYAPPELRQDHVYAPNLQESRRGFVLGIVATVLICAVMVFFIWSTLLSQGFRDSVINLFG